MSQATAWPIIRALRSLNLVANLTMENLALRQQLTVLKRRRRCRFSVLQSTDHPS